MIPLGLLMAGGEGKTAEEHIIGLTLGVVITAVGGYSFAKSAHL